VVERGRGDPDPPPLSITVQEEKERKMKGIGGGRMQQPPAPRKEMDGKGIPLGPLPLNRYLHHRKPGKPGPWWLAGEGKRERKIPLKER